MISEHQKIAIGELKKNPNNPKKHDDAKIRSSISELGFIDYIVVDEDNMILSGHGRFQALQDLGYTEIDVIRVTGWTQEQKDRYLIESNKLVELGGWDFEKLKVFDNDFLVECGFDRDDIFFASDDSKGNVAVEGNESLVLTVNPPEAPNLKEKFAVHFKSIEDYNAAREIFGGRSTIDGYEFLQMINK